MARREARTRVGFMYDFRGILIIVLAFSLFRFGEVGGEGDDAAEDGGGDLSLGR